MKNQQILDTLRRARLGLTGLLLDGYEFTEAEHLAHELLERVCLLMES